jgi:hypothetical protein
MMTTTSVDPGLQQAEAMMEAVDKGNNWSSKDGETPA